LTIGGLLTAVSYSSFYKALDGGPASFVIPIAYSWPIVAVAMSIILMARLPTGTQAIGGLLAIGGASLANFRSAKTKGKTWLFWAGLCALSWGTYSFIMEFLSPSLGGFIPAFLFRIVAVSAILVAFIFFWKKGLPSRRELLPFFLIGFLESVAFISFGLGIAYSGNAIVAPIVAAAPGLTIVLAWMFLNEKSTLKQKIGIGAALLGLILLSL
jgi:drug/metabolite transporter (DMT)-like permease